MATLKVVLDTNVILSGLAYPGGAPGKIVQSWRNGALKVVSSHFIFDELRRVLPRLANRNGLTAQETDDVVDILMFHADMVIPLKIAEPSLRDRLDLPVLGTFLAPEAERPDYLVTGDKDLLVLSEIYPIISPSAFWSRHGS
jgi:uncharacterized protein